MADKIYNLTQEEANVIIERGVSSGKYRILEQSFCRVVLKEKTLGDFFTHLFIFGITYWSYGIFNIIYAFASGERAIINIKQSTITPTFRIRNENFAEFTIGSSDSSQQVGFERISYNQIDDNFKIWLEKGKSVNIAGLNIEGGMLYVSPKSSWIPCVISTNLRVYSSDIDVTSRRMGYWPAYGQITPEARKAYLTWLANGRKDPNADIGYVFLFFYGLEYRFFSHVKINTKLIDEALQIEEELKRLLGIYSQSGSFNGYASRFLNFIQLWRKGPDDLQAEDCSDNIVDEINVGKIIFDKKPIPAEAVYNLIRPYCYLNTPGNRCPDEMLSLFSAFYTEKYGEGIVLKPKTFNKKISYHPASMGINENTSITIKGVSDFSVRDLPTRSLQSMIKKSENLLDQYSRFIGKDRKVTTESKLYLPKKLREAMFAEQVDKLKKDMGTSSITLPLSKILQDFGFENKIAVKSVQCFIDMLSDGNIAFIASKSMASKVDFDMRVTLLLSGKKIKIDENVIRYPRAIIYSVSTILAGLANPNDDDLSKIVSKLTKSGSGRIYLKTIFGQEIKPAELKLHMQSVDKAKRISFLKDISSIVADFIDLNPSVIKRIEKIGLMLSVDAKELHSIIHNAHSNDDSKVNKSLNFDKINKLKRSSQEISEVLDKVFIEDEPLVLKKKDKTKSSGSVFGLSGAKERFFKLLISQEAWDKNDLSKIAKDNGLMLDGILEEINELSVDIFDDDLIEVDDKIYVNIELLEAKQDEL